MKSKTDNKIERAIFTYNVNISEIEQENQMLREALDNLKEEFERMKQNPLMVCEIVEVFDKGSCIIKIPNGSSFRVNILKECEPLKSGDTALCEQKNLTVIKKIKSNKIFNVDKFVIIEKPEIKWSDIGGLKHKINEIKEVIELPLKKPQLFKKVGIKPPKGILLYGPPGTGKTLLGKAVANSTNSTFIEVVGSELVQKFIGEGAKLVKEIFDLAREKAPSIIFIDELDALAATRVEIGTSGEREVQRTFMQLLAEIDGFEPLDNVKIIGCTNRIDILDPAITRPGRLDRLLLIDLPNDEAKIEIFKIHSKNMKLTPDVKPEKLIKEMAGFSGAEVYAVCTEAGYFAIRRNKFIVNQKDFLNAIKKVKQEEKLEGKDYMNMFG